MLRAEDDIYEILNEETKLLIIQSPRHVADDEEAWGRGSIPRQMAAKQLSVKASSVYGTDHNEEAESESCGRKFSSCRWVLGYLCCMARFSQSAIRQCIGMAVVCMTLHSGHEPSRPASTAASASHVHRLGVPSRRDTVAGQQLHFSDYRQRLGGVQQWREIGGGDCNTSVARMLVVLSQLMQWLVSWPVAGFA